MKEVGRLICMAVYDFEAKKQEILDRVAALAAASLIYED